MDHSIQKRLRLNCTVHSLGALSDYRFVVICTRFQGQWLLSRHRARDTWETQGGHIEPGETPLDAAKRELHEESGVTDAELIPVADYCGYDSEGSSNGVVFFAHAREIGALPDSEIAEVRLFSRLPENLTYPRVSPVLYRECEAHFPEWGVI